MTAKLVAEEGLLKELVLSFDAGDQWVIGRDPDACQLLVEDPAASRKHLLCRKTPQGIQLENLSKTNPILVNEEPITQPRILQHGDLVKIGDTSFRFYSETGAHLFENQAEERTEKEGKEPDTIFEEEGAEGKGEIAKVNFDLLETGRWLLKVISGPNNGAEFSMQSGNSYTIGTDPNTCDIVFYDTTVSRQHTRITVAQEDSLMIEDLKSRNGTRIDGELVEGKRPLPLNTVVSLGTSSFVVYDREGEMQTIISPLLPSIVKVLQKEEAAKEEAEAPAVVPKEAPPPPPPPHKGHAAGAFILIAILFGLFAVVGIGLKTLFTEEAIVQETVDTDKLLSEALAPFQEVKYSFNKATGRLLLVGHVLTVSDKNQLLYNLQGLKFIKDTDDSGVIIDEYVWSESNQLLSRNPNWKGVTVHAPSPGHFLLSGYLQTRDEASQVWDYITRNFPYLDLLENKIIVEEDIISAINTMLRAKGFTAVTPQMSSGEITLNGNIPVGNKAEFDELLTQFKDIPGVRSIKNFVAEAARNEAVINISNKYSVTGISRADGGNLNVIINGRILEVGDVLDEMKITSIQPNAILLEKNGITYRIDIRR